MTSNNVQRVSSDRGSEEEDWKRQLDAHNKTVGEIVALTVSYSHFG